MQLSSTRSHGTDQLEPLAELEPEPEQEFDRAAALSPERRASRWWLAAAFVLAVAAFVPDSFGKQVFDTKIDLTVDPYTFLHNLVYLWNPNGWFGYLRNQYQGFVFPTAPFFIVGHLLATPPWLVQRLWMATIVTVAFWGIVRLAERLEIGSLESRLVAGAVFALWPALTMLTGSVSAEAIPGVLAAWATIPLVRASRSGATIRGAALSGVAILCMGGANAGDTLYALVIPALYLLTRESSPRKHSLIGWWVVCVGLATAWWAIPLLFLGSYGFNFLPYVEQSTTTTSTSSATTALSGWSVWTSFVNIDGVGWNQAGLTLTSVPIIIAGTGLAAATGLYGLASREIRERRFLVVSLAVTMVGALVAYWGTLGGPFSHLLLPILNGGLAPLRSVYKLEPAIGLLIALGVAHAVYKFSRWSRKRARRMLWQSAAIVAIVAVLASMAAPYLMGRATNKEAFNAIPSYWYKVADYLAQNSPQNTALVLPAASHGEYVWGWTNDQPLEALARSPWANDQDVPFGGAGSTRMVDAIELALRTGVASPGLPSLLARSGIKYLVVQNDVQWQLSDSPAPYEVHQVLEGSGFTRVAHFGPNIETPVYDAPTLSLQRTTGIQVPYPAVEIFQAAHPAGNHDGSSPVATYPVSTAALVSGGPEAIKQLLDNGLLSEKQAAILAGDWPGQGPYKGPLFAVTDTLRRQDTNFGLVNDNTSYTYTATQDTPSAALVPDAAAPPSQLLPFPGVEHQTVAVLKGAQSIIASSAGSFFFYLPEYNPMNVFDGESNSGWVTGSPSGAVGQWIQINFDHPVNLQGSRFQFIVGPGHPVITTVRVSTDQASVLAKVRPNGGRQLLSVPAGSARYLRVTFASVRGPNSRSEPAGIRSISVPGLHVQLFLKPPQEPTGDGAHQTLFSFQTTPVDYGDLLRSPAEPVMARIFTTPRQTEASVTGRALPRPSPALDALIGSSSLNITASSSLGNLPEFRPQNLLDGDSKTSWIAASPKATIHMQWPHATTLSSLKIVESLSNFSAPPKEVQISSAAGSRLIHLGGARSQTVSFAPLDTNQITVSFPKVRIRVVPNGLGRKIQAPVGLAELDFSKLAFYRVKPANPATHISVPCGFGPPVSLDGTVHKTSMHPTVGDLLALNPVSFTICGTTTGSVTLHRGSHELITMPSGMPFNVSTLSITQLRPSTTQNSPARQARVLSWRQESHTFAVTSGPATYLEVHQNFNSGWTATLNGKALTPIRLDGWQQGYLVPAGRGGTVQMKFSPEGLYLLGLVVGALGVILLVLIASGVLGRRRGIGLEPSRAWNSRVPLWLSIGLAACVLFVVGGPLVLAVPVLVLIGVRRSAWLPWVAFVAMAAAGIVAAYHPATGAYIHSGAFSAPAQACALIALAAVLVPIVGRRSKQDEGFDAAHEPGASTPEPSDQRGAVVGVAGDVEAQNT